MEKRKICQECSGSISPNAPTERFWPGEGKTVWIFHRPCYFIFKARLDAERDKIFKKDLERMRANSEDRLYFGRVSE